MLDKLQRLTIVGYFEDQGRSTDRFEHDTLIFRDGSAATAAEMEAALRLDGAGLRARCQEAIDQERDRRIERDILFQGVAFQSDAKSRALIDKSRTSALAAIVTGAVAGDLRWHGEPVDFFWIASDNARMPMDAMTMLAFGNQAAAREGLMIVAANNLKLLAEAGEAISDVADDALWPA